MLVIGLVGQPSSGKDTAANYFVGKGFDHISVGNILREQMKKLGLSLDRPSMSKFIMAERKKKGDSYPVPEICKHIKRNTVVSGLRNTAEAKYFKQHFSDNFILVALDVPIAIRYQRALHRDRAGDDISFEEFTRQEDKERKGTKAHEVDKVIAMADYTLKNSGTPAAFQKKIQELLAKIESNY